MPYITDATVIDNNLKVNGKIKVNTFNDIQDKNEVQLGDEIAKMINDNAITDYVNLTSYQIITGKKRFNSYISFYGDVLFNTIPAINSSEKFTNSNQLVSKDYVDNKIPNLNDVDEITVNTHIQDNGSLEVKGASTFSGTTELVGDVTVDSTLAVKGTSTFTDTATFSKSPKVPTPTESEDAVNIKYIRENVLSKISLYNHTITFTTTGLGTSSTICLNFLSSKGTRYSSISAFASDHTAKQYTCSGGSTLGATVSSWCFAYKILFKSTSAVIYYQQGNGSPSEVTISYNTVSDFTDVSNAI